MTQPSGSNRQRHYPNIFVGLTGLASLIFAGVGSYTGIPGGEDVVFILAGAGLVALSPVAHKLLKFKLSTTEVSVEAAAAQELEPANRQAIDGEVVDATEAIKAIEASASLEIVAAATAEAQVVHPNEIPTELPPPRVVLAEIAAAELALFSPTEREAIAEELPKVGSDDGNEYSMRWGLQPHEQYRVRRVGDDIRIFFRKREKTTVIEQDSFVVLGFAKENPGPGQERLGRIPLR